jgi:hypothetical protein
MIWKLLNISFFLFFSILAFGQSPPDSIIQKLKTNKQDTSAVDRLLSALDTIPAIPDSTFAVLDTLSKKKKKNKQGLWYRIWKEDYPNPKKALYLSFALPGSGQIYNKRWWKLPWVYGGLFGTIYAINFNSNAYKVFRDAYIADLAGETHRYSGTGLDAGDLKQLRNSYDKNRQLSYVGFVAVYLIQGAEAFVDAHLRTFDVSEDLSLRIAPSMELTPLNEPIFGVGLSFQIQDNTKDSASFLGL